MIHGILPTAVIFLLAAVVAVPISKKLGFGSVLGYLIAGILIGPSGFRLITNVDDILHFSEFGVVLLLFLIGLELDPKKLWQMRLPIFGMGGAQVVVCFLGFTLAGLAAGFPTNVAMVLGMGFSLSSTAMVLQILAERKILATDAGKNAFSILLFQDIAVIAMIAILPLLGTAAPGQEEKNSLLGLLRLAGVLVAVLVAGRLFLRPILRWIAGVRLREVFTALALLLVMGMAALMQAMEMSMALGAFIAGLLLADSEYRHALETDIEPFKGLLLGLFFISVGMSVNLASVTAAPGLVFGAVAGVLALKTLFHLCIGAGFRLPRKQLPLFALILAQVGEFAFVLFDAAKGANILTEEQRGTLVAVSAVSMLATPVVMKLYDFFLASRLEGAASIPTDEISSDGSPVIIAGFGRVGQIVGRFLFANGVKATVLDFEPEQIESLRKFGFKVFYGDATRLDLLEAAGAAQAKILVVAVDDVESSLEIVDIAKEHFPHLRIVCRARNVAHVFSLREREVELFERETFDSSLRLGRHVLEILGFPRHQAFTLSQKFHVIDHDLVKEMGFERANEKVRISLARQAREDIERLFAEEDRRLKQNGDSGWGQQP